MSNINDYLIWRGDIPINSTFKFNEIDSMILARFSYLPFDKIKLEKEETIESISTKMKKFKNEDFNYNGDMELISNMGKSTRFKNMKVTDYVKANSKTEEKQFSAITIHTSDKEIYISFLGTDKTILGWKEDFNMSFMENIPAQLEGCKYLNEISKKYPNKKIRIGGHSKGGNVAVYSAITAEDKIQSKIIHVYNYDGPGFSKNILEKNKNKKMIEKISTYIPQDSVIGRILEREEKCEIVQSIEKGIYQHDIYSWQINRDKIVKLDSVTKSSQLMNSTLKEWLKNSTPKQRKIFFDGVFEVFNSTKANTFGEFSKIWMKKLPTLFSTYREISEEDRKVIINMLKLFTKLYFSNLKDNETKKINKKFNKKA